MLLESLKKYQNCFFENHWKAKESVLGQVRNSFGALEFVYAIIDMGSKDELGFSWGKITMR